MDDIKLKLAISETLSLPKRDADRLIGSGNGDAALLYLYILRAGGELSRNNAAAALHRELNEIDIIARELMALGLLSDTGLGRTPALGGENCTSGDVTSLARADTGFRAVLSEAERVVGRVLSSPEIKRLYDVYSLLGLPADVLLLLLNHCAEQTVKKYGAGRTVTLRAIELEAESWARKELLNAELAEGYLSGLRQRDSELERARAKLLLSGRPLAPTERKYLEKWTELGFSAEALEIAYDRTVTNTGGLRWKYMDSIVSRWHEANLHTPSQIEEGDRRRVSSRKAAEAPPPDDLDRVRRLLGQDKSGSGPT